MTWYLNQIGQLPSVGLHMEDSNHPSEKHVGKKTHSEAARNGPNIKVGKHLKEVCWGYQPAKTALSYFYMHATKLVSNSCTLSSIGCIVIV